ncbi:MAG TPA: hypothetical protein VGS07_14500 [Thermoanaerobaculia bacterium]|jgi:hypothetical protein|nr:hypothetical protein [Thermoanaerobaculia bacterium]
MKSRIPLCLALASLLGLGGPAFAVIGTIDNVPAATLLLPYFEVDIAHPGGVNTFFSINNALATAVLAHVTIWSDQSIPVLDFDVYLTGYDVGWVYINGQTTGDLPMPVLPAYGDRFAQMWLETVMDANGRFSVGFSGVQFDNANRPAGTIE